MNLSLSEKEIQKYRKRFRALSNSARCREAHDLAKRLYRRYPDVLLFGYYEAVMSAEEDVGFTPKQVEQRYLRASKKLALLLRRIRKVPVYLRSSLRNEYYWFSRQPYKQYRLGVSLVKSGNKRSYYSQGVGAVEVAKRYAKQKKVVLARRWAKIAERAWLNFFKVDSEWFNSYFFYAQALGYQGRFEEMELALQRAAKIAGKTTRWKAISHERKQILDVCKEINLG